MPAKDYPLRSVLYTPGDRDKALGKLKELKADAFVIDLEDGVADASKDKARDNIHNLLTSNALKTRYVAVRVNDVLGPEVEKDLEVLKSAAPNAIIFPKVESAEEVEKGVGLIRKTFKEDIPVWIMVETPLGVLKVTEIAGASDTIECLVMGTNDLLKDLHAHPVKGREPLLFSLSYSLLAARAFGLLILDGVFTDLEDEKGFQKSCHQGANLGFDGKTLIHPNQIEVANKIFAPSKKDLERAGKIMKAFEEAKKSGKGVIKVDGQMIEALDVENAKRLVQMTEKIKRRS